MTIPKYNELYADVLSLFSDVTEEYHTRDVKKIVADLLNLTDEERNKLIPSGKSTIIENNISWTITYLKKAGLLESKRLGFINITEEGLKEIKDNPNITEKDLYKFPSFVKFRRDSANSSKKKKKEKRNEVSFFEKSLYNDELENFFTKKNSEISDSLIEMICHSDIKIFQNLVSQLFDKLDYFEFNLITKNSNKLEGIVYQDKLGLDKIGVHVVNASEDINVVDLQIFAGFLVSNGLSKGIFITTSSINNNAINYIKNQANFNIVLVDGNNLAELLIKYNIGVKTVETYEIKAIDEDYFKEV